MRAILIREKSDDKQTLGNFIATEEDGDILFQCKTLELPWVNNQNKISCVPKGTYIVKKRYSAKYKWHYHLTNTPGRDFILIHPGNYHSQILGCILVGSSHSDINGDGYRDVTNSVKTMEKLMDAMPDEFKLEII